MTQEELDSLMSGDLDLDDASLTGEDSEKAESETQESEKSKSSDEDFETSEEGYRVSADRFWPPPPPTDDHKVVNQLDDVTKDSELKATEMFDKLENISAIVGDVEGAVTTISQKIDAQKALMDKLSVSFPKIATFKESIEELNSITGDLTGITDNAISVQDEIMMIMDMMQYQDIHRQKIERVINVMRALSKYMNSLFEAKTEDSKRVSSATHIHGDSSTEDVVTDEDIEALIATLGKKV